MKKLIIIILILLAIIGCVGIIYATGNFDKVVDKVFKQSEVKEDFENRLKFCEEQDHEDEKIFCYIKIGKDYPDKIFELCDKTEYSEDYCLKAFYEWQLTGFEIPIEDFRENQKTIARDAKRKADLSQIMLALEMYYSDYRKYPASKDLENISNENCVLYKILEPYLNKLLLDPKDQLHIDPKHSEYWYGYKSDGTSYELTARLENLENKNCIIKNGICLYKCKDGKCGEKEQNVDNKKRLRDTIRKADIRQIVIAIERFYSEIEAYAQIGGTATMPLSIGESIMAKVPKDPLSNKDYEWIDNTKDSSKFCVYARLEQGGYYAGSGEGTEILDFPPKNLSCW